MKKFLILPLLAIFFWSCSGDSTADVSRVTNYPTFDVAGDQVIFVHLGETYTDPGVTVTEDGQEIEYTTSVRGLYTGGTSIDTNVADIYQVMYSATNVDGFSGTASRTVIVADQGDLVNNIAGVYTSTVVRNGTADPTYADMEYVLIWKVDDTTYMMSDGIGGYYAIGRAYGQAYAAGPVEITANSIPDNDYTIPPFSVGAFGGVATMTDLTAHPDSGTITFTTVWDAGYTFDVTLDQVQF